MLVELKDGETLNGHLVSCDTWMNLTLKEVVQTSPVRKIDSRWLGSALGECAEADISNVGGRQIHKVTGGLC